MNEPTQPHLPPIDELNRLPPEAFAAALKPLFEAAPPLAERLLAARPFASYDTLLDQARRVIATLTEAEQIEVINAHPRIGERADTVRRQSAISYREQGYDREADADQEELAQVYQELADLNYRYEERFGFRFVVFVNRRPKSVIVGVLRERLTNTREAEIATALDAMLAIAQDRLRTVQ
jgi:OHCU decarboxylase